MEQPLCLAGSGFVSHLYQGIFSCTALPTGLLSLWVIQVFSGASSSCIWCIFSCNCDSSGEQHCPQTQEHKRKACSQILDFFFLMDEIKGTISFICSELNSRPLWPHLMCSYFCVKLFQTLTSCFLEFTWKIPCRVHSCGI